MTLFLMALGSRQKNTVEVHRLPKYGFTLWEMLESRQSINKSTGLMTWLMVPWHFHKVEKWKTKMCFIYSKCCASKMIHQR